MLMLIANLRILKVAPTAEQLFYHADILVPHCDYYVNDVAMGSFQGFTDGELREMLGQYVSYNLEKSTRQMLIGGLLNAIDEIEVDDTDLASLRIKLGREYSTPTLSDIPTTSSPAKSRTASTGKRISGQRELIFEHAEKAWEALGKPKDLSVIRKMRIEIMNELEAIGVKRTTASTTLGAWQKELNLD